MDTNRSYGNGETRGGLPSRASTYKRQLSKNIFKKIRAYFLHKKIVR